jgi:uncharacterized repeat protein (TIGR01451 family)
MKTALHISALGPVLLGLVSFTTSAQAAGVDAGTLIQNTASATYTSGSGSGSVTSNTVTIKVDELLDVAVTGVDAAPISTGAGTSVLSYSLTNTGNGPEAFKLTANPSVSGNNFDTTIVSIVIDSNGNGSYDAGVDQVLSGGAATPLIAADGSLKVFVIVSLPAGATDAQTSQVRLTADSATGTGTPGTVFAGQGEGGGDAVVGSSTASANALESVVASLATVSLSKSAVIADQFGGTQPVPGAVVTFTLTASVSGSGNADGLSITDAIPAGTTYQSGTLKLEGSALTDAADSDAGSASSAGIAVGLGTVAGGSTRTVNFNVKIN